MPEHRDCSQSAKTAREFEKISRTVRKLNPLQPLGIVASIDGETEYQTSRTRIDLRVIDQDIGVKPALENEIGEVIVRNPKVVFHQHSIEGRNKSVKGTVKLPF